MIQTIVTGWTLSVLVITLNPLTVEIEVIDRSIPYLSQDTCIKEEDLSLVTGKRESTTATSKIVKLCTPVLQEVER